MKNYFNYKRIKQKIGSRQIRTAGVVSAGLAILFFVFWVVGLFRTPANFRTVKAVKDEQVSLYLTNYILPELHNKSQYDEPFDFAVSEDGINDVIARHVDGNSLKNAGLSDLTVAFRPGRILLTGRTEYYGFDFVVTMVFKPVIDKNGHFSLGVSKFQAGSSRIPFAAEAMKEKMLSGLGGYLKDPDAADFVKSLFDNSKIEPVFSINRSKLRVGKITAQNKKLIIHFLPEQDG